MTRRYSAAVRAEHARHAVAVAGVARDTAERKLTVLGLIKSGEIKSFEGAAMLGISTRQMWRYLKAAGSARRSLRATVHADVRRLPAMTQASLLTSG